jgi:prefoldin beta subunit
MVKVEVDGIKDGYNIYRVSGPALIKQETVDAQLTIDSRLKYLTGERERVEKDIEAVQNDTLKARAAIEEILKQYGQLQAEAQKLAQQAQGQAPAPAGKQQAPKGKGKK